MSFKNVVGKFCKKVYDKIYNKKDFVEESKMKKEDFTRNRKVGFGDSMLIVLNKTCKGLRAAIRTFLETTKAESENYSRQAFSKSRMKIKWEAFREIFRMTVEEFYQEFKYKTYDKFRVFAIDGTKINLPFNPETINEFGIQNSSGELPQALGSCLYDVLNGILIDATINPCRANERELAKEHIDYLAEHRTEKDLILFDRGYPSAELLSYIDKADFKYMMRADYTFVKGILKKALSNDCIVQHTFVKTKIEMRIRILQIPITDSKGDTITEILITNIFDKKFTANDFEALYHLRWGIETKYNDVKNKLEIEQFSGTSPLAIKQDFYATMFLNNLASMMIAENAHAFDLAHNSKNNKYEYKANVNAVISILKDKVIEMLITDSPRKGKKLMKYIYSQLLSAVTPIRPDRSYPRVKKHKSSKFSQNNKS